MCGFFVFPRENNRQNLPYSPTNVTEVCTQTDICANSLFLHGGSKPPPYDEAEVRARTGVCAESVFLRGGSKLSQFGCAPYDEAAVRARTGRCMRLWRK